MLDERLSAAADLAPAGELAADVGTDHGLLPCALLEAGVYQRMILTDISEKALSHARAEVSGRGLGDRVTFCCGDGLKPLAGEACRCVFITGMGGSAIAGILREGRDCLPSGAALVLSPHTEPHQVRRALRDMGYHLTAETICQSGGRRYLLLRAEPGQEDLDEDTLRRGRLMYAQPEPALAGWLDERIRYLRGRISLQRLPQDSQAARDLAFYLQKREELFP